MFGRSKYVITTKDLIDNKTLANLEINCIVLEHSTEDSQTVRDYDYAQELEFIVTKPERNDFLVNLMGHFNGNTLCLFLFVEKHG